MQERKKGETERHFSRVVGRTTKRPAANMQTSMKDMFQMSWSQRGHDIYVVFMRKSPLINFEKFDIALTDCSCSIKTEDGGSSGWSFFLEVKAKEAQRVQNHDRLLIIIPKKDPTLWWPTLKKQTETVDSSDILPPLISAEDSIEPPPEKIEKIADGSEVKYDVKTKSEALNEESKENGKTDNAEDAANIEMENRTMTGGSVQSENITMATGTIVTNGVLRGGNRSSSNQSDHTRSGSPEVRALKPLHNSQCHKLSSVKHNWHELNSDVIVFTLYVPHLDPWGTNVTYGEDCMQISFKTGDEKFHNQHGTTPDVLFLWNVKLSGDIVPLKSSHNVTLKLMEIKVTKKEPGKWTEFLSPSTKADMKKVKQSSVDDDPLSSGDNGSVITDNCLPSTSSILKRHCTSPTSPSATIRSAWSKPSVCKPGYTGLDNLGNTCFMNSVLQALSNTRELREYFLERRYLKDINIDNPLGMHGKMAEEFANLMSKLWCSAPSSYAPVKFRSTVGEKESRFIDYMQHDAQEFMAFLLDKLHEDLNRIKKKPYYEIPEVEGREDHLVAEESWKLHTSRNDSYFVDLFHGMFKSKLICPDCKKNSIKFDPFLFLSVPLPKATRLISLHFFPCDLTALPTKFTVSISKSCGKAIEVLSQIAQATGCDAERLRMFEVYRNRVHRFFLANSDIDKIVPTDVIFVCETLSPEVLNEPVYEIIVQQRQTFPDVSPACYYCKKVPVETKTKRCTKCERVAYCNQECQRADWPQHRKVCEKYREFVGMPFIASVPKSRATYSEVKSLLIEQATLWVELESFVNGELDEIETIDDVPLQLSNMNWNGSLKTDLPRLEDFGPDQVLDLSRYKLIALDWETDTRLSHHLKVTTQKLSCAVSQCVKPTSTTNLYDCVQLFTEPEVLAPQEAWYCPKCQDHKEATKQMSLWKLPDVLIIQLKRFSFKNYLWRDKIDMFVDFPVKGLDMSRYCISQSPDDTHVYDLFAVVNHHGGIFGGHYTSYVRLPELEDTTRSTVGWRVCDDSHVMRISEDQVVTKSAYVMFYRRRKKRASVLENVPRNISLESEKEDESSNLKNYGVSPTSSVEISSTSSSPGCSIESSRLGVENETFKPIKPESNEFDMDDMPPLITARDKTAAKQNNPNLSSVPSNDVRSTSSSQTNSSEREGHYSGGKPSGAQSVAMNCFKDQALIKYDEIFTSSDGSDSPKKMKTDDSVNSEKTTLTSKVPSAESKNGYTDMDAVD